MNRRICSAVAGIVLLGASASILWAQEQGTDESTATASRKLSVSPSGFLGDYSDLVPHPKQNMLVWHKHDGVLAQYDRFLIERPLIYFHEDSSASALGVDPDELMMLSNFLVEAISASLRKGDYELADEPAPGVLILRTAITDVVPVDPKKNMGVKAAGAAVGIGLIAPRADLGRAAIEVEMIDGSSGERVAAVVAERKARRFGGTIKGFKRWGDVKAAFEKWAKRFRRQLDQARRK